MNNKGFTLIELLAVIVVLAIVTVLATTTVLPYMSTAREDSFRIEATNAVSAAESAYDLSNIGQVDIKASGASCKSTNKVCFTIAELYDLGIYKGDKETFSGKVEIDITNSKTPRFTLWLKKNDEFKIIGGTNRNYKDDGELSTDAWNDNYATCTCS